jgi:hypothetical protein
MSEFGKNTEAPVITRGLETGTGTACEAIPE